MNHFLKSVSLAAFSVVFAPLATAEVLFQSSSRLISAQVDQKSKNQILIWDESKVHLLQMESRQVTESWTRGGCMGGAYAHPYLMTHSGGCQLSEGRTSSLTVTEAPANAFYTTYIGEDGGKDLFLFNGRPWNTEGYIYIKAVDRESGMATLTQLVRDVPSYSGAMTLSPDGQTLYYSEASGSVSNTLHTIEKNVLLRLYRDGQIAAFRDVATRLFDFPGLSMDMAAADHYLLYFGYDQYLVDMRDHSVHNLRVNEGCLALGMIEDRTNEEPTPKIIYKCDDHKILIETVDALAAP